MRLGGFTADWRRPGLFALILALHGLLLAWLSGLAPHQQAEPARPFSMRMIAAEPLPPLQPVSTPKPPAPPRPSPSPRLPAPPKAQPPRAAPVLTAATPATAATPVFSVPAQPAVASPAPAAPSAPVAPVSLVAAHFDAETLHNPKPSYPPISRRLGEEGRVVLKVLVRPDGTADTVDVAETSGYPRLDQAAREAVLRWRFIPARRGDTPVASSLRVPLLFRLEES